MDRRSYLHSVTSAVVATVAGCTGSPGSDTPTATPTPFIREFPYTATSQSANVPPRNLSLDNGTKTDYRARVRINDIDAGRTILDRTVTVEGQTEHTFEEIIGKVGTYRIRFELEVGVKKLYEWPIGESNGDAEISIEEGDSPTEPVVWYSIDKQ